MLRRCSLYHVSDLFLTNNVHINYSVLFFQGLPIYVFLPVNKTPPLIFFLLYLHDLVIVFAFVVAFAFMFVCLPMFCFPNQPSLPL